MKKLSILLSFIVALALGANARGATSFQNENLKYVITYKWGLIHQDAGEATLSLRRGADAYSISLTAKTKPWADKLYQVRDTLKGAIRISDFTPLSYAKITHEKGKYKRDDIRYSTSGGQTTGYIKRYRTDKNGKPSISESTLSANGPVFDMLSVFYFLRTLDYAQLAKNKIYTATIFSGSQKEKISIRCLGLEKIKLRNKKECMAYHIRFNFTRKGGKKSSDDMDTWISTDSAHIPLYLVGKLPIGEVRAYFLGS